MKLDKFFTYFWLIITICCFVLIGTSLFVDAGDQRIGLEWDANTEECVIGYTIHVGEEGGPYELIGTNHGIDNTEYWWYGILPGDQYYFIVRAFSNEISSGDSNEVCGYIKSDKDYGIECGTEYPEDDEDENGGGGSGGCFINSL